MSVRARYFLLDSRSELAGDTISILEAQRAARARIKAVAAQAEADPYVLTERDRDHNLRVVALCFRTPPLEGWTVFDKRGDRIYFRPDRRSLKGASWASELSGIIIPSLHSVLKALGLENWQCEQAGETLRPHCEVLADHTVIITLPEESDAAAAERFTPPAELTELDDAALFRLRERAVGAPGYAR